MALANWHFRKMSRDEINQGSIEREFFAEESLHDRIVREVIQNSLDAKVHEDAVVRVRFGLHGLNEPLGQLPTIDYFDGLQKHLIAGLHEGDELRQQLQEREIIECPLHYLVIEDSGTTGLNGDWQQFDDSETESAQDNHFYWFFRNVGRSGKSAKDAGSWGLGKWVLPDASQASVFIAVTKRASDAETVLMGQAVLTKHNVGAERFAPYGYFGELGKENLPLPLRISEPAHKQAIEECVNEFDLRFRKLGEPGLSVVIPFPRQEDDQPLSKGAIIRSLVHNYFYPIIAGKLEVVVDEGIDAPPTVVNSETIESVLNDLDLPDNGERSATSYRRLFEMCREGQELAAEEMITLARPPRKGNSVENDSILMLKDRYERGELLVFRIWTEVEHKPTGVRNDSSFRLFLQKDDTLTEGQDYHVRGMLSIAGPTMDFIKGHRARALVIVDNEEPLAAMLRDSEPPAHTSWRPQHPGLTKTWVAPQTRIDEVRRSPATILGLWREVPVEVQRDALADIFPSLRSGEWARPAARGRKVIKPIRPNPPVSSPRDFVVSQISSGFNVRLAEAADPVPQRGHLWAAYDVLRGNPLGSYNPLDFRLHGDGALAIEASGCTVSPGSNGNELFLEVDDPSTFSVRVQGFDPHRDVYVDVRKVADDSPI